MQDFLTFKVFITPTLLLIFYYMGALTIPVVGWYLSSWVKKSYFSTLSQSIIEQTTFKWNFILLIIFFVTLLSMEIFWRVLFEFFIAYFDMHDALMQINLNK